MLTYMNEVSAQGSPSSRNGVVEAKTSNDTARRRSFTPEVVARAPSSDLIRPIITPSCH